ncbi:uncharacterized protein LOC105433642 [Pogonomyrmex barbatus]|uniref:Uncharacterized protein LOC105433642 n=1 Tax=Pogonomyrmex barbatus TaxID=144034 RepID=A0A6I9WTG1_9HYME|nr:uncharacterized protein LOC105433642 [Pogonomyrmex barbatus]
MGALSLALPLSTFLYLLPLMTNIHEKATSVAEQLNNLIDISVPKKEIQRDDGEITLEFLGGPLSPSEVTRSTVPMKDSTKLNVGFQAKVESKKLPLSPHNRRGISANVQFANQAKCSQGNVASNENKASKEFSSEEEWAKSPTKAVEDATIEESRKNMTLFRLYVPDIKDAPREKFAKASMQLGLDVGVTSKKDTDGNADKTDGSVVDNHARRKKNYVRLCKRITDGSTTSLMQKLRKDCVKLPRSEFYLEQGTRNVNKDDTIRLVGKTVQEKENESNENKQRDGMMADVIETPISDISANYDESDVKVIDKFGMGLNIKTPVIAKLLRNDKISLSTSTTR